MALRLNGSNTGYVELDVPAAAGSHTLTLPNSGGSSGQYLQTNGSGALSWVTPAAGGKILQVVQAVKTNVHSSASTSFADIPSYSASITPASASNKILVIADVSFGGANGYIAFKLLRNSTDIYIGDADPGGDVQAFFSAYAQSNSSGYIGNSTTRRTAVYLDSPATTSSITYKVQMKTNGITGYINRGYNTGNAVYSRTASSITLLEVAG